MSSSTSAPEAPDTSPDAAQVAAGQRFVEIAATWLVAVSLAVSAFYIMRFGTASLPQHVGRFILTGSLAWALVRGKTWARWVTVVLAALAFMLAIVPIARGAFRTIPLLPSLLLLGIALGYGIVARGLLYSASVRAFFATRRRPPQG